MTMTCEMNCSTCRSCVWRNFRGHESLNGLVCLKNREEFKFGDVGDKDRFGYCGVWQPSAEVIRRKKTKKELNEKGKAE